MGATSIHVQAVKPGSEIHNFREKELDYVRPELSHLNESWVGDSISHRLESAKQRYFDTVGQKMQTKAAPIREGVIVIKQETTMQELQQFAAVCKERFGIEAFQIHIHKDEGYMNAKQWTPNLHAHVVFDWTQPNGKSVRLSRDDMAELQTIASEALGMERGVSSDRKHLSAMQYKTECAKEQLQELSNDISSALDKHKDVQNQLLQLQKELRSIETKKNVQKLISKASEKFYGLIGKTVNDREKDALKAKIKALEGENEQLSDRLGKAILEKERNGTKVFKAENDKEYYRQQMDNARTTSNRLRTENQELKTETKELKKELGKMKDLFNSEQLEALRHHFPNISKAMEEGKDLLKQITRSRGFGMGMYPPPAPKGGATKRQLHSMECYSSSKPSDNCRFSASSFFWAAKVFFRTYVFVNETLSPLKTINGLMNQLYSFGPLAMISLCTSSANPLYMALSDLYWVYSKHFRLSKIIISFLGFMQVRIYPKTRIADCDRLKKAAKFARYSFANCSSSTSICRINEVLNTSPVSVSATATTAFLSLPVLLLYFLTT